MCVGSGGVPGSHLVPTPIWWGGGIGGGSWTPQPLFPSNHWGGGLVVRVGGRVVCECECEYGGAPVHGIVTAAGGAHTIAQPGASWQG